MFNRIAPYEAAMWNVSLSRLQCRIRGESGGYWNAWNGQYGGVGQFASSTFYRGVSSIGLRRVTLKTSHTIKRKAKVILHLSDGTRRLERSWHRRQRVVLVRRGVIPQNPDRLHAWAQVRIMARALAGLGDVHDSEWEVRC